MTLFENRSQRLQRQAQSGQADIYTYVTLPDAFRGQVIHIWIGAIGDRPLIPTHEKDAPSDIFWGDIYSTLCRAKGQFQLSSKDTNDFRLNCIRYFEDATLEEALDMIELTFQRISPWQQSIGYNRPIPGVLEPGRRSFSSRPMDVDHPLQFADEAIEELNARFEQHSIGYEFIAGHLVRKDSKYIHAEVTAPAITLLQDAAFKGASDEFLNAQEHYKNGKYKESAVDAFKAFESTMKSICDIRQWHYDPATAAATDLIKVVFDNHLMPSYLLCQFTSLRSVLASGVTTVRNKTSGHGQDSTVVSVPQYIAAYTLHLAAANIVFLINAHKSKI